jgi:FemAB-related protein (PEP-CTERM system-associated)
VNTDQKSQRRNILADPVAAFTALHPEAGEQTIATLSQLGQQYGRLKEQHREAQQQSRKISRQIGAAKRTGQPIDSLRSAMQEHSVRLDQIAGELDRAGNRIMDFFASSDNSARPEQQLPPVTSGRSYKAPSDDCSGISISLLDNDQVAWNAYARQNPAASIYHRIEWRALIRRTFGHSGYYFLARNSNGNITGILPLIRLKSRLFGDFLVSMPYFNYGGAIADSPAVELRLMQAANEHAQRLGVRHVEYRDDIPRNGYPVRAEKVNMILPLPDTQEILWQGFTSKLRSQVKRPRRENPRVHCGGIEYLEDFYSVFARNMRDLGTPVYGKRFFLNILDSFPEESRIIVIRLNNRPVAAGFLMDHGDMLEIPWASTVRDINRLSMNMLLYWEVLKLAIAEKHRYFDFGRSSMDSGTFHFKQQWGAQPKRLHWHYWLRDAEELPMLNPANPRYALMINLWKKLPLQVSKWLGPAIVKNLP